MNTLARIISKGQTTIQQAVCAASGFAPGDSIVREVRKDGLARVRRTTSLDPDYLRALEGVLAEWSRDADEAAYREL
jgi:hypothetical protein